MSVNSSSLMFCSDSSLTVWIYSSLGGTKLLVVLPLCILVLSLWWRRRRSPAAASHSDVFTHHLVVMELMWVVGFSVTTVSSLLRVSAPQMFGSCLSSMAFYGELFFHMLTCVERYVAVVHPTTYQRLRTAGVRVRNASIGCVWLLSCSWTLADALHWSAGTLQGPLPLLSVLAVCLLLVTFCSLSVLCTLSHPGPAGVGGAKRVDQRRLRAFYLLLPVTAALWLWVAGFLVALSLTVRTALSSDICVAVGVVSVLNIPSSLVLPALYVHRARRLACSSHGAHK